MLCAMPRVLPIKGGALPRAESGESVRNGELPNVRGVIGLLEPSVCGGRSGTPATRIAYLGRLTKGLDVRHHGLVAIRNFCVRCSNVVCNADQLANANLHFLRRIRIW